MGFFKAMKGANNMWGTIVCADGIGTIGPENFLKNTEHKLMITIGIKTFTFSKKDVQNITIISSTSEWVKYLISLKNGKSYVATFMAITSSNNSGKKINIAIQNFEWWMFDLIYLNNNISTLKTQLLLLLSSKKPLGLVQNVEKKIILLQRIA